MRVISCLVTEHNLWLVALAAVIGISGAIIAFRLFSHMRNRSGHQVLGWAFLSAVAAGSSIWCTHFIAMLAYEVSVPVAFDPILTLASLIIAITGCGLGFAISSIKDRFYAPLFGGAIVGLSVALMHYIGMAAYHVSGLVEWSHAYVVASVMIATTVSALALNEAVHQPRAKSHILAPALFIFAIVGLHFTGMAAMEVTPMFAEQSEDNASVFHALAVAVAGVAIMIIGTGVASYLIDEISAQETVAKLRHMAMNDSLTGLPNRVHFNTYMDHEIKRANDNGWRLAVVGIDLDRFKTINDQHGHEIGDQVLALIGNALSDLVKPGEFIARIGGDEFSALKRYENIDEVHDLVARLENALNRPLKLEGIQVVTGGSIGVALFPEDGEDMARLVSNADLAMYRAKGETRTVCFYEERMDDAARERSLLSADLHNAIANDELELHYQVQGDVADGSITAYEVLLRWRHPMRGMVPPSVFIPIAEETGFIWEIGEWVLRTACREAGAWTKPHKVAVNVSGVQLQRADFADVIHGILVETGFPPGRLEIEITETAIVKDKTRALHTFRKLRALGITVAIDDFGIGYSSLETLRLFPFDKIKIDQSFTQGLASDPQTMAIVRAVLALGKSLNIKVLAEGVENDQQLETLRGEGCDEAQGYLLGRPARIPCDGGERDQSSGGKRSVA